MVDGVKDGERVASGVGSETAHDVDSRATPLRSQGNNSGGRGERAEREKCSVRWRVWYP
jgi:hypothetical protein